MRPSGDRPAARGGEAALVMLPAQAAGDQQLLAERDRCRTDRRRPYRRAARTTAPGMSTTVPSHGRSGSGSNRSVGVPAVIVAQLVAALLARHFEAGDEVVAQRCRWRTWRRHCVWLSRISSTVSRDWVCGVISSVDVVEEARRRIDRIARRMAVARGVRDADRVGQVMLEREGDEVAAQFLAIALEQAVIIVIIDRRRLVGDIRRSAMLRRRARTECRNRAHCPASSRT